MDDPGSSSKRAQRSERMCPLDIDTHDKLTPRFELIEHACGLAAPYTPPSLRKMIHSCETGMRPSSCWRNWYIQAYSLMLGVGV